MAKVSMDLTELRELESRADIAENKIKELNISTNKIIADLNSTIKRYEDSVPTIINKKIVLKKDISISDNLIQEIVNSFKQNTITSYDTGELLKLDGFYILNKIKDYIQHEITDKTFSYNGNELNIIKETKEFANFDHIKATAINDANTDLKNENKRMKIKTDNMDNIIEDMNRKFNNEKQSIKNKNEELLEELKTKHSNEIKELKTTIKAKAQLYIELKENREHKSLEDKYEESLIELNAIKSQLETLNKRNWYQRLFNKKH